MKRVSIIVPIYNREKDLMKCYKSLINQTYKNLEIIFVDDGSTDNTLNILKSLPNITVLTKENGGPASARRYGLKESTGEYISFVDSDDKLEKHFIERMVNTLESTNTNICLGRMHININDKIIDNFGFKARTLPKKMDVLTQKKYLSALNPCLISKLFKREYVDLKEVDFKANEDISIIYSMYTNARYISYCKEAIYYYKISKSSQVKNCLYGYKYENIKNTYLPLETIYNTFKENDILYLYYESIEMIFIKNIAQRIFNLTNSVKSNTYRNKFINNLLDFLEYYFPTYKDNIYYEENFKLGEITDKYYIYQMKLMLSSMKRTKLSHSIEEIKNNYMLIEEEYDSKKKKKKNKTNEKVKK